MTTIVNTPGSSEPNSGNSGVIIAIVLLIVVVLLLFYGLPQIRRSLSPSVNVPDEVDVNVNTNPDQ